MIHYSTVLDIRRFKDGPKKCCIQTKIYRLYRKMTIYSHFHTLPHDSCGVSWYHIGCPPGVHLSIFLFPDDNSSKYQWIFTKLGMFFDILDTWLWIANGQISSVLTELSACNTSIFSFADNSKLIFTNLDMYIDIVGSGLGLIIGKFYQFLINLSASDMIRAWYYCFTFLFCIQFKHFTQMFI